MTHEHENESGMEEQLNGDEHSEANQFSQAHGHDHKPGFTIQYGLSFQDRVLLKTRELLKPLLPPQHGHHHKHEQHRAIPEDFKSALAMQQTEHGSHHHNNHIAYKAPGKLTDALALYSIKKLSILDHHMPARDARLINPVKPGVLSWLGVIGMSSVVAFWGMYVLRTTGPRGFAGKGGLVFAGLLAGEWVGIRLIDELRELTVYNKRRHLVESYRSKFGEEYLLSVLNPAFQLSHHH